MPLGFPSPKSYSKFCFHYLNLETIKLVMTYLLLRLRDLVVLVMEVELTLPRTVRVENLCVCLDASPPPTSYNLKSDFLGSPSNKAFTFGISREAYENVRMFWLIEGVFKRASSKR